MYFSMYLKNVQLDHSLSITEDCKLSQLVGTCKLVSGSPVEELRVFRISNEFRSTIYFPECEICN